MIYRTRLEFAQIILCEEHASRNNIALLAMPICERKHVAALSFTVLKAEHA
jgi:hypothetical protein